MVKILVQGQLGNQMFQYAAGLSLASKYNVPFKMISSSGFRFALDKYFSLPSYQSKVYSSYFQQLKQKLTKRTGITIFNNNVVIDNYKSVHSNKSLLKSKGLFEGFFQSVEYFQEYEQLVRSEFKLKQVLLERFSQNKIFQQIKGGEWATVHIRLGDYEKYKIFGKHKVSLPIDYYTYAINKYIEKKSTILILSNDINQCKKIFSDNYNYVYSDSTMTDDFQFLQHSKLMILSNSSFAWWAAYLRKDQSAQVIAPNNWLGYNCHKEYPVGIMNKSGFTFINH